eukprot:TRINITY_DN10880_c0_g1_i1.p2 TRINITY_DN10880_c0_g1~~TRINITY_DN10880_c0_g1_i1.p2  ORF type:complete len:173 (+),score=77.06 TRINITY_DN10880_c0_g1_i1:165-683(+)
MCIRDRAKYTAGIQGERDQRRALEDELDRLRLELRDQDSERAVNELESMDDDARSAIEHERAVLHAELSRAETELSEVREEVLGIDGDTHQAVAQLFQAMEQLEKDMLEAHREQREAEIKVEQSRGRASKVASEATLDKKVLQEKLVEAHDLNHKLTAELEALKRTVGMQKH